MQKPGNMKKLLCRICAGLLLAGSAGCGLAEHGRDFVLLKQEDEGTGAVFEIHSSRPLHWESTSGENRDGVLIVRQGDKFYLDIESNPTTGYFWELSVKPADGVLKIEENTYMPAPAESGFCGAPGVHRLTLSAQKPGQGRIAGRYRRAWEKNPPVRNLHLEVKVLENN